MAVTFVLGLLIATAGTATAARLITGRQIKDGSIGARDLSKTVRARLAIAGRPGPKGDVGPQGPKGDTGAPGPGRLFTAFATVPDGVSEQEILSLSGYGVVVSTCSSMSPNFTVAFKNTSGQTIEWERQAATSGGGAEAVGTAAPGELTGGLGSSGNATIQVTVPASGSTPARVAVIRIAQRLTTTCRVSVSALAG